MNYFKHLWNKLFIDSKWNIAYKLKDSATSDEKNVYTSIPFQTKSSWYADPFVVEYDNKNYLFCEAYINKKEKGCIAVWEIGNPSYPPTPRIIIENDYHMSFPFLFTVDNVWYMLPETSENGTLELYKSVDFPYRWKKEKVLLENIKLVDSVVFEENNRFLSYHIIPITTNLWFFIFDFENF